MGGFSLSPSLSSLIVIVWVQWLARRGHCLLLIVSRIEEFAFQYAHRVEISADFMKMRKISAFLRNGVLEIIINWSAAIKHIIKRSPKKWVCRVEYRKMPISWRNKCARSCLPFLSELPVDTYQFGDHQLGYLIDVYEQIRSAASSLCCSDHVSKSTDLW